MSTNQIRTDSSSSCWKSLDCSTYNDSHQPTTVHRSCIDLAFAKHLSEVVTWMSPNQIRSGSSISCWKSLDYVTIIHVNEPLYIGYV